MRHDFDNIIGRLQEEVFELEREVSFLRERLKQAEQTLGRTKIDIFSLGKSLDKKSSVRSSVEKIRNQIEVKTKKIEEKKKEIEWREAQRFFYNIFSNKKVQIAILAILALVVIGHLYSNRHIHTWEDATCINPEYCTECGKTRGQALGHDFSDPTCTEPPQCRRCGVVQGDALGHDWQEATCLAPATCRRCFATNGQALGHTVPDYDCEVGGTCTRCGETIEPNEHNWSIATCESPKTCYVCGKTEGELADHRWIEATCENPKRCYVCGKTEGETLEHQWVEATCTEARRCAVCNTIEGTALGHEWKDATCSDPKTCTRCGATEGKALGHDWQEATYTKPRTCNRCGVTDGEPIPVQYLNATGKDIYDAVTKGESVKDPLTGDLSGWYMRAATVNGIDFEVDSKGYSGRVLLITVMDSVNVGKTEIYYKTLRAVFDGDDLDTITSWVKKNIGKEAETKIGDANVVLRLTVSKYPIMYIVDDAYLKEVL